MWQSMQTSQYDYILLINRFNSNLKDMKLRFATYNILNTKDRYDEREALLKQNLYGLNADIIGLQEVVYGDNQLDELVKSEGVRHSVEVQHRHDEYFAHTAAV